MEIRIVRASVGERADANALLAEYHAAVDVVRRDTPEQVSDFLSGAASAFWIAYVDEVPAGHIPAGCLVLRPLPGIASAGECKRLYVRLGFRGKGIAQRLLDAMEQYARTLGLRWVYLDSKDDLEAALHLYRKRGYSECPRYNDNPQATLFLRRRL